MMKVLHINCNYLGTMLHQTMIEHLDNEEVENHVFVPTYDKNIATFKINNDVCVSECFSKKDRVLFFYKSHKIKESIVQAFDIASFDLIHAYTLFTDGNVAYELNKQFGIPYVVAIRNTDINAFLKYKPYLKGRGRKILENASAVFFLSETYRQSTIKKLVPLDAEEQFTKKTFIIPNGIDDFWHDNEFKERHFDSIHSLEIIYAGVIDKNKNIISVAEATKKLKTEGFDCHLTVIGKVKDQEIYNQLKEYENVSCIEAHPKEKLIDYYRSADIFVMASHRETFGLVYAEALSQGLPVLYTKGQGFDGQFPEGEIGYSVDDNDIQDISYKIKLSKEKYEDLAPKCVDASRRYDWKDICKKYKSIYLKIVN